MMHDTTRLYIMRLYIISYWRARRADQCDDNMVRRWYVKNDQDNAMAVIRGLLIDGHGCPFPGVSDKNKPTQLTSGTREHRLPSTAYHLSCRLPSTASNVLSQSQPSVALTILKDVRNAVTAK